MNVDLRVYLERVVQELDRRIDQRFESLREEVAKTERHTRERLNVMKELKDEIQDLQKAKSYIEGRLVVFTTGISVVVAAVVSLLILAIERLILN